MSKNYRIEENQNTIEKTLKSEEKSTLDKIIEIESYHELSNESKFLIKLVLDTPKEFFHLITTPSGIITKNSIKRYFIKKWPLFVVDYVFNELKQWVKNFR